MPMTKEQILAEAKALDPGVREALAEELRLSLDPVDRRDVDAAWLEEVRRRDADFKAGQETAAPLEEVVARVLARGRP